ncbi:MAG: hypothetical protein WBA25_13845 [Jannaschia sp.]
MPHPSRRSQQQLDLFEPDAPPLPPGMPSWTDLPMGTQTALTGLVARMLIAQAQSNAAEPSDPEACDDRV